MDDIRDCFMCKKGEVYGDDNDPCIDCSSKDWRHKKNFYKDGRFCAEYCNGFES